RMQKFISLSTPPYRDAWKIVHPDRSHDPSVGLYDKAQWPTPDTFDFVFVSEDLKDHVRDLRVDAESRASDHQAMMLVLD
ncbi:MAG: endonuclease/exonuclease/phosphatase family protein, partial [Burkholderiaceae bacterium]